MKKFLLSLIMMAFAGYVSAQSFTFEHNGEAIEPGTYNIEGDVDPELWEMKFACEVINLTDRTINVKCDRVILEQSHEGSSTSTCFGECAAPFIDNTTSDILANSSIEFSVHFTPAYDGNSLVEGSSLKVQYSFYENEGDEPAVFVFNFTYTTVSVNDYTDNKVFSNAYPNPAKNMVSFDYNMPNNVQTASVAIYNMMGQEVLRQDLNIGGSRLDVNVSDLTDGVYFYSLIVNNQAVKTNKLVVSK